MAGDWWDEQGVPQGGAIDGVKGGIDTGGQPDWAALDARAADPNRVQAFSGTRTPVADPRAGGAYTSLPTMGERTGAGQPGGQPGGGYQPYSDQALQDILHKYTPDYAGVRRASEEADRVFGPGVVKLLDHPTKLDKFQLPDGRVVDTVIGAGGASPSWTWGVEGGGGGGATLGGVMGGGGSLLGSPMAGRNIVDDPSYKFVFEEGQKALERSAAAKGTLLTGGMLKALTRYGQGMASTQYGAAYNRASQEQGNTFNRLFSVAGMGLNATNSGQQLASGYAGNVSNGQLAQGNAQAAGTAGQAAAWGNTVNTLGGLAGSATADWVRNRKAPGGDTTSSTF